MTQLGKYSSYKNVDWYKELGGVEHPKAIADIHIIRSRKDYIYELDGVLLEDGSTRPSREPRVAPIMAAYLRFGQAQPFTLREGISATYDAGRHPWQVKYHSKWTVPEAVKQDVITDHWVLANTSDTFSCATRCHMKIVLRDATIVMEKLDRGVYIFHCNPPSTDHLDLSSLMTHEEFCAKYRAKFEREGIK